MSAQLQHFFKACDPEGTRSVDREAFRDLCGRLNIAQEDADVIFEDLDHDRDGRISFTDFSRGFSNFISTSDLYEANACRERQLEEDEATASSDEATKHHVWTTLTTEAERVGRKNSDEGKLKWLLNELQSSEQRHLVPYLEGAVEELLNNLQQLQEEKTRLEDTWKREKTEHEKHLKRMEEELDHQVKEAEMKMRMKAQEEVEDERKTLQTRMNSELDKLQAHIMLTEKVYSWLRTQPSEQQRDVRLDEVRTKLDEAVHENRQLRMSLLDTQTSIALMRSELLQLRTMYEEKCRELSNERERILDVLQEQDHLSRQLNLLHEANKRLLDSHDVLRSNAEVPTKQGHVGLYRCKSGSIIGDYLDAAPPSYDVISRFHEDEDLDDDDSMISNRRPKSMDCTYTYPVKRRHRTKERQQMGRQSLNHSDSGVSSTVRDSGEVDEAWEATPSPRLTVDLAGDSDYEEVDLSRGRRQRRDSEQDRVGRPLSVPGLDRAGHAAEYFGDGIRSSASHDSVSTTDTLPRRKISDIKRQLGIEDSPASSWNRSSKPVHCSTPKGRHLLDDTNYTYVPTPMPRTSKVNSIYESIENDGSLSDAGTSELNNNNSVEEEQLFDPTGPPEHTFKVIFVGDAGVGKSTFALRISKGVFVRHMSSTLGLDFLMRNLRVDGKNLAVQLWDTAGQERFRSITKTYFRKADGVMLLYDCTCEQSFLNVRQWVEDIDVSCFYNMMADKPSSDTKPSSQRIPLMVVANKVDLRGVAMKTGTPCVSSQDGEKLAKDCDTLFIEGSAKDGSNVLPALANLVRSMVARQELQKSGSTMQLCEAKPKKGGCCSK